MDETVNTGDDLCKCAEGHELYDLDLCGGADFVSGSELDPRILCGILVAEGDLALFLVKADDVYIDLVADGEHLCRVLDAVPAHFGNVDHAVDAADVDECTVAGHGLHDTVVLCPDFDLVPNCLGTLTAFLLHNGTDGADNTLAGTVELGDLDTNLLLEELSHVGFLGQTALGCGNEYTNALYRDDNAALVDLGDGAFENAAVFGSFLNVSPALCSVKTLLGEHYGAFNVVHTDNDCLDGVTDFDSVFDLDAVIGKFRGGNEAGILGADVNTDFGVGYGNDGAGYLISIIYSFDAFLQHFVKGFLLYIYCGFINFNFFAHLITYLLNYP